MKLEHVRVDMSEPVDASAGPERCPRSVRPLVVDVAELLQGRRELRIRHAGETYSLRLTRREKLILTK